MICEVYRSLKKADTYLYLPKPGDCPTSYDAGQIELSEQRQQQLPRQLLELMGALEWVMDIDLDARDKLAQLDSATLKEKLRDSGFFLQLPPTIYHTEF